MQIVVLGAAAGGGFPQWNGNDPVSRLAWEGKLSHQTQSSMAVSNDGERWVLLNASPDLRQQIRDNLQLHPAQGAPLRSSPIAAVVLTNADVDHIAGLLNLRESQPLALYAHKRVRAVLSGNSVFNVLNPEFVTRRDLPMGEEVELSDKNGNSLELRVRAFPVPGKIALWLEEQSVPDFGTEEGDTLGLQVIDKSGKSFFYIPACAEMTPDLIDRLRNAELVFFDGTLWRDDEMISKRLGNKSGRRMGHVSCATTISAFTSLNVRRKFFIHINNTNPLFEKQSSERAVAVTAGWDIAEDGMKISL